MQRLLTLLGFAPIDYTTEIQSKLQELLYENFLRSSFVIVIVSSFLTYALWSTVAQTPLVLWYVSLLIITLLRFLDARAYTNNKIKYTCRRWHHNFSIGVILSALLWALLPLVFFSETDHQANFFIAFVVLGMTAGAINTLAANLSLMHIYLYLLIIPLTYSFLQLDGAFYNTAVVMSLFFVPLVSISARHFHETLVETYNTLELYKKTKEALVKNEERLRMMFDQAPIGIFYYDNDLTILECNKKLEETMQASKEQLVGLNLNKVPDSRPIVFMRQSLTRFEPTYYEGPYQTKIAGLDLYMKILMTPLIDVDGTAKGGLCMMEDKTKEHEALVNAEFFSLHDPLTGLANRKLLDERIKQVLLEQKRQHLFSTLLFLDLDHFKQINDSLGHNIGDKVLIETTRRLKSTLRESDTLSRLGGDEFVILLPHLSEDHQQSMSNAYEVAQKIHHAMSAPFEIDQHQLFSSASIGISLFDHTYADSDEILRQADMAMYLSKDSGRKCTSFYNEKMDHKLQHFIEMQKNLHHALERQEFTLNFQPILSIDRGEVIAAETLLRWRHEGKLVPTDEFINVAESSTLINDIGKWVIEATCQQIQKWHDTKQFTFNYITINVSARQLLEEGFNEYLLSTLNQYHIKSEHIRLEITETALISNFEKAKEIIEVLNAKGIEFIIDDFGTGYSSLSYLKMLPFTALKIDKSFVEDIQENPEDEKLIRAIIHTAKQFDYQIIAEGIETQEQRALLEKIDRSIYFQGYLAAKPLSAEAFQSYLQNT